MSIIILLVMDLLRFLSFGFSDQATGGHVGVQDFGLIFVLLSLTVCSLCSVVSLRYEITEQGTDYVALSLVYEARLWTWLTAVDAENHHITFHTCL